MSSSILNFQTADAREAEVRASLTSLLDSLNAYRTELTRQERKLQEARNLQLDQLTDSNSASIIRNLTAKLEEKEGELSLAQLKCLELEEQARQEQNETKAKSRHIEKLSALLLSKEEKIQELEKGSKELEGKVGGFQVLLESREEACNKWKTAAQEAAEKMRNQLETLKSSEEMNRELKQLLDTELTKSPDAMGDANVTAPSDVLSHAVQQFVTSYSTPQTTVSITNSDARKPSIINRNLSFKSPSTSAMTSTPKPVISTVKSSTSPYARVKSVKYEATPQLKVIRVSRVSSPGIKAMMVDGGEVLEEELVQEPVGEVVVRTAEHQAVVTAAERGRITPARIAESAEILPEDEVVNPSTHHAQPGTSILSAREDSGISGVSTPRVRFQDESLEQIIRNSPGKFALLPYPAPVPNFSPLVANALDSARIHDPILWKYFIRECVHFYYDLLPTTDSQARNSYFNIGRTLYEKYPFIAKEGPNFKTPWTYFNTCLSSRLRNERFAKRRQNENRGYILPADNTDNPEPRAQEGSLWREGCHL